MVAESNGDVLLSSTDRYLHAEGHACLSCQYCSEANTGIEECAIDEDVCEEGFFTQAGASGLIRTIFISTFSLIHTHTELTHTDMCPRCAMCVPLEVWRKLLGGAWGQKTHSTIFLLLILMFIYLILIFLYISLIFVLNSGFYIRLSIFLYWIPICLYLTLVFCT